MLDRINHAIDQMSIQAALALSGVFVTSAASIAAVTNIGVFTAFVSVGASAGVFYSFLGKGGGLTIENRRNVKARIIVGMIGGVATPRGADFFFPKLSEIFIDPILLIAAGFVSAWLWYSIGHAFFQKLDKREDKIAAGLARAAEKSAGIQDADKRENPDN